MTTITLQDCINTVIAQSRDGEQISLPTLFVVNQGKKIRSKYDTYCKATNERIFVGDAIRHYTILFIDGSSWSGWTSEKIMSMVNRFDIELRAESGIGWVSRSNCNVGIFRRKKNQTSARGWTHAPAPELPQNSRQNQNPMPTRNYGRGNMVCEAWK